MKFSPAGSTVTVAAETVGTEVEFRVRDQGRGIPADKLESIFGRFQQVDSTDSREQNGSGLGLAISRGIVESHGGRIWARSQVGAGSTFCFTLPAASGSTTGEVVIGDVGPGEVRQPKVLVCDGDPEVRALLVTQLERRGYDAVTAARGRDVAVLAVTERPDVVILELDMDGGTGWERVERLKSQSETRHIPVIVMSALTTSRDGQLAARTDGWILKPVDNSAMGEVDGAAIGRHDARPTVLLVEDDLGLADVLTTTFNRRGVRVVHAATEREAIEVTRSLVPDALVLDLYLPDGDGFAVVAHMRQDLALASIPVVVYSAHEVSGAARDRLRLGETVLFTKGRVSPEDLESRVLDLVGVLADSRQEVGECLPG